MKIVVNGKDVETGGESVSRLLEELGLRVEHVVVELNKKIVKREEFGTIELSEGDSLEIVTLVGGG